MDQEQSSKNKGKKQASASANRRPPPGDQISTKSPESLSAVNGLNSEHVHSPSTAVPTLSPCASNTGALANNIQHRTSKPDNKPNMSSATTTATASSNNCTNGHTPVVPDTTTLQPEHGMSLSSQQPISKQKPSLSSALPLPFSVGTPRALAGVNGTVPSQITMLSPFTTEHRTGQNGTENLSLSGYIELMTLQQGGMGNGTTGSTFHSLHPPLYNTPSPSNTMFPLQPTPTSLFGGKTQPASRASLGLNHTSAFQPTTSGQGLLTGGLPIPQHSSLSPPSGTKMEFAGGNPPLSLSLPPPLPPPSLSLSHQPQQLTGGAEGSGGGGGQGAGRKRTHEESLQQERNSEDMNGYGLNKVNMFPVDGGCGQIVGGDSRRGSTSDSLSSQPLQQLKWQAHIVSEWHGLHDGALQEIPKIGFHVETDKGFNFSLVDDSFVCQKKNHFQVTVTVLFHRPPKFLKLKDGSIQPIERFVLDLHGVRFEQVNSHITLEQSKADRSKTKFEPKLFDVPSKPDEQIKETICRLHFSETTQNNMRKRGKPNPDQKHFSLVVSLSAETKEGTYLVVAHVSERIIVRASNPGNFDNDCDYAWLKGTNPEIVYHHGRVGINMDKPEEALSVHGNLHLTGQILQVSDRRVKKNIQQLDSQRCHLETLSQLNLYEYQLDKNLCPPVSPYHSSTPLNCQDDERTSRTFNDRKAVSHEEGGKLRREMYGEKEWEERGDMEAGRGDVVVKGEGRREAVKDVRRQVGLLAQEVERILPHAVRVTDTTVSLSDGSTVSNLLVVDKDQILMETIGAVQELKNIANTLEHRLTELESAHEHTNRQTYSTTGISVRSWPMKWHPLFIIGLLMMASLVLFLTPLLLA